MSDIQIEFSDTIGLIERIKTGLFSFDLAAGARNGELGLPLRTITELYGYEGVGKSSLSYFLSGKIGNGRGIVLMDMEGFNKDYVISSLKTAQFSGKVKVISLVNEKGKILSHSDMANEWLDKMRTDEYNVGIFDSIGAFVPDTELAGEVGDANIGRKAIAVNQIARKSISICLSKDVPTSFFFINHVQSVIGGKGHQTPGGTAMKYLAANRIYLYRKRTLESGDKTLAFLVGGVFEKLRFGVKGRQFQFVVIPELGVSPELTAVFDCCELGLASCDRTIKIRDISYGYFSKIYELAVDRRVEKFEPFFEELESYYAKRIAATQLELPEERETKRSSIELLDE